MFGYSAFDFESPSLCTLVCNIASSDPLFGQLGRKDATLINFPNLSFSPTIQV